MLLEPGGASGSALLSGTPGDPGRVVCEPDHSSDARFCAPGFSRSPAATKTPTIWTHCAPIRRPSSPAGGCPTRKSVLAALSLALGERRKQVAVPKTVAARVTRTRAACPLPGAQETRKAPLCGMPTWSQSDPEETFSRRRGQCHVGRISLV
jgi:hypothetical protein